MTTDYIQGAYLNAEMDKIVTIKFRGSLTKFTELTAPEVYRKYVSLENRKTLLYARLNEEL